MEANNPNDTVRAASLDKLGNNHLRSLNFEVMPSARPPSTQFWSNCFTHPRHLQRLISGGLLSSVPDWMAHADRLAYLYRLEVQELRSDGIQVLGQLPCLIYLRLIARTIPEKNIIIHPNTFPCLQHFDFHCELSCLAFEPATMPRLQRLEIHVFGDRQGAMQLQEEQIIVVILTKCENGSQVESAWRAATSRHPKSQAIRIHVQCLELDKKRNVDRGTSKGIAGGGLNTQ